MRLKISIFYVIVLFVCQTIGAQLQNLSGTIIAEGDVEGIHILNKTLVKYTVSNANGNFNILTKVNDTLVISALKYQLKEVVVSQDILNQSSIQVYLTEKVNELDEVVVGKILTGNIGNDIGNVELKNDPNFYDLGIPGYTGKPKTTNERKLADADGGSWGYIGIGAGVNLHKLLNAISGRTKKLKQRVELDEKEKCRKRMKDFYGESIFKNEEFTIGQQAEYFYFCMDDPCFKSICQNNDPSIVVPFLEKKLKIYKSNLETERD